MPPAARLHLPRLLNGRTALVAALLLALPLAGCASSDGDQAATSVPCPADLSSVPHDEMVHIEMQDLAFRPEAAQAAAGQVIMWVNAEDIGHTVTPNEDEDQWPGDPAGSGSSPDQYMQKGDTWLWCFEEPGTYAYHCVPHASRTDDGYRGMVGTVTVV